MMFFLKFYTEIFYFPKPFAEMFSPPSAQGRQVSGAISAKAKETVRLKQGPGKSKGNGSLKTNSLPNYPTI